MHGGIPEERLQRIQCWADAGHHLYMLSNNNDLHWHHVFSHYDLSMFRHCYASHLLHLAKPDPRIYQAVDQAIREQEGNQPFYFVDDLEANRLPAEQLGWRTFASLDELACALMVGKKMTK